ncbi:MAG: hypothetical protein ACAH83_15800 [Alphaproteobacteria bacterium]
MTDDAAKLMKICTILYAAYAACALSIFAPFVIVVVAAAVAMLAAIIYAYVSQSKAVNTIYETHLRWLIRTFWIGGGVYMPVLTIFMTMTVWTVIDFSEVEAAVKAAALEHNPGTESDSSVVVNTVLTSIMQENGGTIVLIILAFTLPVFGWWLWRCWQGYSLLKQGKPVEDVMRWV